MRLDLTGQQFGRWRVGYFAARDARGAIHWQCRCACGKTALVTSGNLRRGTSLSCGCLQQELARTRHTTHGEAQKTPEYIAWDNMKARCSNPKHKRFKDWGGRGIKVCERWLVYANFLADMGRKPDPSLSIERSDNDGDYEPNNCYWATTTEQSRNRRPRTTKEKQ
jgi:hypothetical protein